MTQSSLTGFIGSRRINIIDISKQVELDTYQKIEFSILAEDISIFEIRGKDFSIYSNNTLFASGIIIQRPAFQITDSKNTIKISAVSELGRLSCERAYSLAYYQDELVVSVLNSLLSTSNYSFTLDATTFADAAIATTTIDLRSKETLFSQIVETIKSYPDLHMREVLNSNGDTIIQIGEFNDLIYQATEGQNLIGISIQSDTSRVYSQLESYGGLSPSVRVSLNESLVDGRAIASSFYAQFPIVIDGNGLAYVENTLISANCSSVKDFELHRTDNEAAVSQADINDAAFALYQKTVRYLQQNDESEDFDISIITPFEFLKVGDRIQVNSKVDEEYYNSTNMSYEKVTIIEVDDDYRIVNINTKLEDYSFNLDNGIETGILFFYDIRVTNSEDVPNYDTDIELYERLDKPNQIPSLDALQVAPPVLLSITHNENTDASDCSLSTGQNSKTFIFDIATTAPVWATGKNIIVSTLQPSAVRYEVVQNVGGDLTDVILCVSGAPSNLNWGAGGASNDVTVEIVVIYT